MKRIAALLMILGFLVMLALGVLLSHVPLLKIWRAPKVRVLVACKNFPEVFEVSDPWVFVEVKEVRAAEAPRDYVPPGKVGLLTGSGLRAMTKGDIITIQDVLAITHRGSGLIIPGPVACTIPFRQNPGLLSIKWGEFVDIYHLTEDDHLVTLCDHVQVIEIDPGPRADGSWSTATLEVTTEQSVKLTAAGDGTIIVVPSREQ